MDLLKLRNTSPQRRNRSSQGEFRIWNEEFRIIIPSLDESRGPSTMTELFVFLRCIQFIFRSTSETKELESSAAVP
ncbi:MAG: hypothetical protein AAF915_06905 [Cyanobacteria bacterium P01_D01_bin.50]